MVVKRLMLVFAMTLIVKVIKKLKKESNTINLLTLLRVRL